MRDTIRVRVVGDIIATDTAGRVVESVPVIPADAPVIGLGGSPLTPWLVAESADGMPVRVVEAEAVQNSAGDWVDAIPVMGLGPVLTWVLATGFWDDSGYWRTDV